MSLGISPHYNALDLAGANAYDALSAVFLALLLSWFFVVWCLVGRSIGHHVSLFISVVAAFQADRFMGESIGWTLQIQSSRPVWYIRYISCMVHGPVALQCLLAFTRMEASSIFGHLVLYLAAVYLRFVGTLNSGWRRWGLYGLWICNLLPIVFVLLKDAPLSGFRDKRYRPLYFRGVKYLLIMWMMNAILWAFSEGIIPPTLETALAALFDLISGSTLAYLLIRRVGQVRSEAVREVGRRRSRKQRFCQAPL